AQGERFTNVSNSAKLPGYGIVNLKAKYDLAKHWAVEAKVNNLLDKEHSTSKGYSSLDRTYLLSLSYNR
ncbi:MAG: TonB-dependent receptor, partial [Motiliproteus sp.]